MKAIFQWNYWKLTSRSSDGHGMWGGGHVWEQTWDRNGCKLQLLHPERGAVNLTGNNQYFSPTACKVAGRLAGCKCYSLCSSASQIFPPMWPRYLSRHVRLARYSGDNRALCRTESVSRHAIVSPPRNFLSANFRQHDVPCLSNHYCFIFPHMHIMNTYWMPHLWYSNARLLMFLSEQLSLNSTRHGFEKRWERSAV